MVDFGIEVVGATGENDATDAVFTHVIEGFAPLFLNLRVVGTHFLPAGLAGSAGLLLRDTPRLEDLCQTSGQEFLVVEGHERR